MKGNPIVLSERVTELPPSNFERIMRLATEDSSIISLSIGEPDFTAPPNVLAATKKALDQKMTHYSPAGGRHELLEAIGKKLQKENKIKIDDPHQQIMVTSGSTEGLLISYMGLLDAGEEMLVPDPGFIAYPNMVDLMQGEPVSYALRPETGFELEVDRLPKLITNKTKAIQICSPSNPTGNVLTKKTLEELADFAIEKNLMILADEAYEHFVYEGKHVSMASLNGISDRVLTFHTFSKSYAMPGYRLGYVSGPANMISLFKRVHLYTTISSNTFAQIGALEAFKPKTKRAVEKMRNEYNRRRKFILKRLEDIPALKVEKAPQGAFYLFPKITTGHSSQQMADLLLKKAKVLTVPGNEFGKEGEGFLRFSYATALPKIKVAMDRIEKAFK